MLFPGLHLLLYSAVCNHKTFQKKKERVEQSLDYGHVVSRSASVQICAAEVFSNRSCKLSHIYIYVRVCVCVSEDYL